MDLRMNFYNWLLIFIAVPFCSLSCMLIGNPGQPALQTTGIFQTCPSWWSFRVSYLDDFVYQERYRDEFKLDESTSSRTSVKFSTYATQLTLNIKNRIDFYGILGSSRIQIDEEIFTKRRFSWGTGLKLIVLNMGNFQIGTDFKYFETDQKPTFFVADHLPYNVLTDFRLKYHEIQAALGMTYRTSILAPYIYTTYLISKIEPEPMTSLVRLPQFDMAIDVVSKSVLGKKRWGMALGITLIDQLKATLSFEWRLFNQNAIDVNGEIRF